MSKPRLVIVSNRLPVNVKKVRGKLVFSSSNGGLATGLASIPQDQRVWIGWPGIVSDGLDRKDKDEITAELAKRGCVPVFLTRLQVTRFYDGYCNATLWPLFHYFPQYADYRESYWEAYKAVNEHFANTIHEHVGNAATVWIQDYQLMLLPSLLRAQMPRMAIGFFLHIPFPSYELFRLLPQRRAILEGLLGADLIGFHTHDYARHFLSCALNIGGYEYNGNGLNVGARTVRVDAFPMGIDTDKFETAAASAAVDKSVLELAGTLDERQLVLSVDRLDYSKGIPERLEAYYVFLKEHPELHGKVTMLMLAVPSRTDIRTYKNLRMAVEQQVSRINGNFGSVAWTPIRYLFRELPFDQLVGLYRHADVALVTPLRDGMNLVAKEYVAAQIAERPGVLVLSEMAGAAYELSDAVTVNPIDRNHVAAALYEALTMPLDERNERLARMQSRLRSYTIMTWAEDFLAELAEHTTPKPEQRIRSLSPELTKSLITDYKKAKSRLLLLDYDGTLAPYASTPDKAAPSPALLRTLRKLSAQPGTEILIISGRSVEDMQKWFGDFPVSLAAEHGACTRPQGKEWFCKSYDTAVWKESVRKLWEPFARRTPGAFIEEKRYSLVWHYRRVPGQLAATRLQQLIAATTPVAEQYGLGLHQGQKVLEIKTPDISKAVPTERWLALKKWQFVLAAGDDYTDEDTFNALPDSAHSIKVGPGSTAAKYRTTNADAILELLKKLAR